MLEGRKEEEAHPECLVPGAHFMEDNFAHSSPHPGAGAAPPGTTNHPQA